MERSIPLHLSPRGCYAESAGVCGPVEAKPLILRLELDSGLPAGPGRVRRKSQADESCVKESVSDCARFVSNDGFEPEAGLVCFWRRRHRWVGGCMWASAAAARPSCSGNLSPCCRAARGLPARRKLAGFGWKPAGSPG